MKFKEYYLTLFAFSFMLLFGSAYAATAFFANGGLTENGIEWCEENYQLYQFMGVDFFEHHKHSIESRICASLYQDLLWTYSGYDRYEKLVEQSRIYAELEINEGKDEADSGIIDIKPAIIEEIPQEIIQQQKELDEKPLQQTELVEMNQYLVNVNQAVTVMFGIMFIQDGCFGKGSNHYSFLNSLFHNPI